MKLFECQSCGHPLYFENTKCERCHHQTGYLPDLEVVSAVEPEGDKWVALADRSKLYRFCANWELHACNWMVEADSATPLCRACRAQPHHPRHIRPGALRAVAAHGGGQSGG